MRGIDVLDKLKVIPDLVPPGHQGEDLWNPASKVTELSKSTLSESNLVIVCGLSGEEPDTKEVEELLESISKEAIVYQVGLTANLDENNVVANFLRQRSGDHYQFLDAKDVPQLISLVKGQYPLHWSWDG